MRRLRGDDGAYAILYAITIVLFIAFAGIVVDISSARADRRINRLASDAAVLAAASELRADSPNPHAACIKAGHYLNENIPRLDLAVADITTLCQDFPSDVSACPTDALSFTPYPKGDYSITMTWPVVDDSPLLEQPDVKPGSVTQDGDKIFDGDKPCQRFAVSVNQERAFIFGPVVEGPDGITTRAASVGRAASEGETDPAAVALILLEQQGCNVLEIDGTNVDIEVLGNGESPGFIHADTVGTSSDSTCSNRPIFYSNQDPDTAEPARIMASHAQTAVDGLRASGVIGTVAHDGGTPHNNVYSGTPGLRVRAQADPAANISQTSQVPIGRPLVTRRPVDARYRTAVASIRREASNKWDVAPAGFTVVNSCTLGDETLPESQSKIFVNCDSAATGIRVSGAYTITGANAHVIFNQSVSYQGSSGHLTIQDPRKIFVRGSFDAARQLSLNTGTDTTSGCQSIQPTRPTAFAVMVVRDSLSFAGEPVRMCGTAVVLGRCTIPASDGTNPRTTPECSNTVSSNGGRIDWSAPNATSAVATPSDWARFEDLALWHEGASASGLGGNTDVRLSGVFMLPNANSFSIGGTGAQDVKESQYVVRRLRVGGVGVLSLQPNPNNVVTIPYFGGVSLIR